MSRAFLLSRNSTSKKAVVLVANKLESGFFTIWVMGLCMCLFAVGGLSFDLWNGFSQRRQLAAIADGASVVGASQIDLEAFKVTGTDGPILLDQVEARRKALDYINTAKERDDIPFTKTEITFTGNQIQVELARELDVTLIRILNPAAASHPYVIEVTSTSEPSPS